MAMKVKTTDGIDQASLIIFFFRCECWRGYFGTNCELDQCFHKPCGDHGVCSIHATTGAYICTCEKGFEGKQCQTPIDPCKNMNCIYGTCEIDSNLAPRYFDLSEGKMPDSDRPNSGPRLYQHT